MDGETFRQKMAALPEPPGASRPPYWDYWRHDLWQRGQTREAPTNFAAWPCVYHTMLVEHWPAAITTEFETLVNSPDWPLFSEATVAPAAGPQDFQPFTSFSRNLIHQAYHLKQWQDASGRRVSELSSIAEFGGGYGAMALVARRLGFSGTYTIYDLPEFSLLQQWYLSQFGGTEQVRWGNPDESGVDGYDLTMALYSISEVEPEKRLSLLPLGQSYLFLYSGQWQDYDNVVWFQELFPNIEEGLTWQHTEIGHLPDRNNWYSIGW